MTSPSSTGIPRLRPASITFIRILIVLSGFISTVNGILQLGPDAGSISKWIGVVLVALGLASWLLAYRLRRPGRSLYSATFALMAAIVVVRLAQFYAFRSPAILGSLLLPAFVIWRLLSSGWTKWFATSSEDWESRKASWHEALGARSRLRRAFASIGAVGLTAAALVAILAAGIAFAMQPFSFPAPVAGALIGQDRLGDPGAGVVQPTGYISATDGTRLAYFAFLPDRPIATLVFYHGGGAHSSAGYLEMGGRLSANYGIATFLIDMRGHGSSGGAPGDAPSKRQMWQDTRTAFDFVRDLYPALPEFLGGHSSGAGLVLNSSSLVDRTVAGYVFLAPDLGLRSATSRQEDTSNFATVYRRAFLVNALTNGLLDSHAYAVGFAYTRKQILSAKLVDRYTVTMALSQDASKSAAILAGFDKPLGVWIGSQDEVFDPAKVIAYLQKSDRANPTLTEVPGADHLGILKLGADYIGPWIALRASPGIPPSYLKI